MNIPSDKIRFRHGITVAVAVIIFLILFAIFPGFYTEELYFLGLRPRTLIGLVGIFTAPVFHGDLEHLLSNCFPLMFAIPGLFYFYYRNAVGVIVTIYLLSGFWVWASARDSVHIGASGVVNGLLSFLFFACIFQKNRPGFAVALVILFLYGAPLLTGFFPSPGISFESHISGATAGLFIAAFLSWDKRKTGKKDRDANSILSSSTNEEITFNYNYKPKDNSEK